MTLLRQTILSGIVGPTRDAFGLMRTSQAKRLVDERASAAAPTGQALLSGGATQNKQTDKASFALATGGSIGGKAIRQTRTRGIYHSGQSHECKITFTMAAPAAGIRQRVGIFDDQDGLFLEANGTALRFVVRSYVTGSAVDTVIEQAAWDDPMDGTGASGVTLDLSKAQILRIDYQWLGVGSVRFGFAIDGATIIAHETKWANVGVGVYMSNPNLPGRWEIEDVSAGVDTTLEAICCEIATEGRGQPAGIPIAYDNDGVGRSVTNAQYGELLAIRLDAGGVKIANVRPRSLGILNSTGGNFLWELWLNGGGTTGGTWSSPSSSYCEMSVDRTMPTTGYTSGVKIASGYGSAALNAAASELFPELFSLGYDIGSATADILSVAVYNLATSSDTFYAALAVDNQA